VAANVIEYVPCTFDISDGCVVFYVAPV